MNTGMVKSRPDDEDGDRTDELPVPQLDDGDTGTLAMPVIPVGITDLAENLREREQSLERANRQIAALESRVAQLTHQCAGLQQQCDALRELAATAAANPVQVAAPEPAPARAPSQFAAPEVSVPPALLRELAELRRRNASLLETMGSWQAQLGVREAMLAEAEAAAAAGSRVRVPSPQASAAAVAAGETAQAPAEGPAAAVSGADWQARCQELLSTLEAERAGAAEREGAHAAHIAQLHAELETLRARVVVPPPAAVPEQAAQPIPVGSVLRVLVRQEHGTEVMYPLGRHTSIGRTPDNDIQVNASWVSRHHAVVLAGTDHCIVEDLNSTNGLLVNGHRIDRQVLHDGDTLTIGKTHFRYQQRT